MSSPELVLDAPALGDLPDNFTCLCERCWRRHSVSQYHLNPYTLVSNSHVFFLFDRLVEMVLCCFQKTHTTQVVFPKTSISARHQNCILSPGCYGQAGGLCSRMGSVTARQRRRSPENGHFQRERLVWTANRPPPPPQGGAPRGW